MEGWICPVCGRGNSPYTSTCPCIPITYEVTCAPYETPTSVYPVITTMSVYDNNTGYYHTINFAEEKKKEVCRDLNKMLERIC